MPTPTKERRRKTVAVAVEVVEILWASLRATGEQREKAANAWADHDVVYCQPNGRPIDPWRDWDEWAGILEDAGLPHHHVHAARYTAATLVLEQGVALAVVQEILVHRPRAS